MKATVDKRGKPDKNHRSYDGRHYRSVGLLIYDTLVHGFNDRFVWRCSTGRIMNQFYEFASDNHCDVGVGGGLLLRRFHQHNPLRRIHLIDGSAECLKRVASRLPGCDVTIQCANLHVPLEPLVPPAASISANYIIHCLHGPVDEKQIFFDNLKKIGAPGARVFGSTVVNEGGHHGVLARMAIKQFTRMGLFDIEDDGLHNLERLIDRNLNDVNFEMVGSVLLFNGTLNNA